MASFFENAMYGVLYGYTPEVFPTPHRGTGDAFAAAANRITGLFAPIIAVYSQVRVSFWILALDSKVHRNAHWYLLRGLS